MGFFQEVIFWVGLGHQWDLLSYVVRVAKSHLGHGWYVVQGIRREGITVDNVYTDHGCVVVIDSCNGQNRRL